MNGKKDNSTIPETKQLKMWEGNFGDEYINRNVYEDWKLDYGHSVFKRIVGNLDVKSALEIGSNVGLNLRYLRSLLGKEIDLFAVEPNKKAYNLLINSEQIRLKKAWNVSAFDISLPDAAIDLVFTSGVLIHISPKDLKRATDEIVRISKKYVLCIEYFSHKPITVEYRDKKNLLFKMDFGSFYLDNYPVLNCIDYGFLWQRDVRVFDDMTWWLFEKQ